MGMTLSFRAWSILGACVAFVAVLLSASPLLAQSSDEPQIPAAFTGAILMVFLFIGLAVYLYISLALQTIATKTGTPNAWLAWIPIVNFILMLNVAKKPLWWIVLFLVPLVNIVISVIVWMGIAEARGKPNFWGILTIVPLVNILVPGYLAWAD
jgi:hypothetical protein